MFKSLEIFQLSYAMASHAAARQSIVAQNMANADTPGYVARDTETFKDMVEQSGRTTAGAMRSSRKGHIGQGFVAVSANTNTSTSDSSPNGNSVSLEEEMMKAVEVQRQHDRALAIYKSSLTVLRATLGR